MFNVTGGEVMIILVLALVILGPEKLPDMIRKAGRLYGEVRRMANGFQSELRDAFDEPTRELRETAELARNAMTGAMTDMTSAVQNTFRDGGAANDTPPALASGPDVVTNGDEAAVVAAAAPFGGLNQPPAQPRPAELVPAPGELAAAAAVTAAPVPTAPPATGAVAASLPTPLPPPPPPAPSVVAVTPLASPLPPPAPAPSSNGDHR